MIPSEAHAKLTARLVEGQDPVRVEAAIRRHLERRCPAQATLAFEAQHGWSRAYAVPPAHPLLAAAERALETTHGKAPVRVRIGATLPLADIMRRTLGIDTVMFSFSTADEDYHAPNEFLRERAIEEGLAAWVGILALVADQRPDDYAPFRHGPSRAVAG